MNNIFEVTNLKDLKTLMESNVTVILGLTCDSVDNKTKVMIRKFLKRKSEQFSLITFIYMDVSEKNRTITTLNILKGDNYPKVYHIRNNNQVLVSIVDADYEGVYESFSQVEKYYLKEMDDFKNHTSIDNKPSEKQSIIQEHIMDPKLEKQKQLEKLVYINSRYDNMRIDLIKEIKRRKKLESIDNKS
jgi:FlaA1/EpsC-like NDP-sugar epimerase